MQEFTTSVVNDAGMGFWIVMVENKAIARFLHNDMVDVYSVRNGRDWLYLENYDCLYCKRRF